MSPPLRTEPERELIHLCKDRGLCSLYSLYGEKLKITASNNSRTTREYCF